MWQGAVMGTNMTSTKARDVFGKFAKSFAALGLDADRSKLAFMAIGQMMSKGKISAEELTQQLSEHLPGATKMLAKSLGVTNEELYKMMKAGKVLSEETLPKLADTMYNSIGKGAADNIDTLTGKINLMANAWENMKLAMGKSQGGITGWAINAATTFVNGVGMAFRTNEQVLTEDFGSDTAQRWLTGLEDMYVKKAKKLKTQGKSYGEVASIIDKDIEERKSKLNRAGLVSERAFLGGEYSEQYGNKFMPYGKTASDVFMKDSDLDAYNKKNQKAIRHAEITQGLYKTAKALDSEKILNSVFKPSTSSGGSGTGLGGNIDMPKVGGSLSEKKVTHINFDIGTMVSLVLNGANTQEVVEAVKREVPKALLTTLNDANIIMTQNQR
jgi:tape measure domain-containing protein